MKRQQTGSVLAISLVLLTVITLVAVMSMQRAGLQTKIVGHVQHKEAAFQKAQSELEKAYRDIQKGDTQVLSDAMNSPNNSTSVFSTINTNIFYQISIITRHLEPMLEPGNPATSSLRNGNSRGKNGAGIEHFEIESIATLPSGINSNQIMGITILSPE
ncbi:MAG: hypothetical protein ACI978_001482 [Oleispira sp.]|jgi:hypothetical protein